LYINCHLFQTGFANLSSQNPKVTTNKVRIACYDSLTLQNALKKSDWGTLNYISHQIKPSLDILGLNATKEKARAIESLAKTGNEEEVIRKFVTELCQELDTICKNLRTEMEKL